MVYLVLGVGIFGYSLINWVQGQAVPIPVEIDTIQGIVIFGTFIAIYAYLAKLLSRLTFSAFHLMRDAEEREQLTHVYLSLINEKSIDEKSRDIVLQALFSRAETGLLTGESGPTIPPNIRGLRETIDPK